MRKGEQRHKARMPVSSHDPDPDEPENKVRRRDDDGDVDMATADEAMEMAAEYWEELP